MIARQTIDKDNRRLSAKPRHAIPCQRETVAGTPGLEDETEYLLRSPANRERLLKSVENIDNGEHIIFFETLEEATQAVLDRIAD